MKRRLLITLVLLLLCIGGIGWFSYMQQKTVVLKFGMFAGSNWDVPNGDSYKIIDQAIERFEKAHPNVRVEYVSGLQKADYSEWLSQQALEGDLPDVCIPFVVPVLGHGSHLLCIIWMRGRP